MTPVRLESPGPPRSEREPEAKRRRLGPRTTRHLAWIIAVAALVRGLYLVQLADNPFFHYPIVDAETYDRMASAIAAGQDPYPGRAFFQPPLYPYFLGSLYRLAGRHLALVRGLQLALGIVNALLTYALARRLFGARIALGCGLTMALYGTLLFYEAELLPPVVVVFLDLALVLAALACLDRPSVPRAAGAGALLGLGALAMAVVLPFGALLAVGAMLVWRRERQLRAPRLAALGGAFLLGVMVVIAPVTFRNWRAGHELVWISTNSGVNLYLGTGRDYARKVAIRPGAEWRALADEAALAGYASPRAMSSYFTRKAWAVAQRDPEGALRTFGRKLYLLAHGNEIPRNQAIYPFRSTSWVLAVLLWKKGVAFPYGVLWPLAAIGAALALAGGVRRAWVPLGFVVAHALVIAFFFVAARYRMNAVPFLVLFAVYGAARLGTQWRHGPRRRALWLTLGVAALLLFSNWRVGAMPAGFDADAYYNLGTRLLQEGRPEAKAQFQRALEVDPHYGDARGNLGVIYLQEGDLPRARACFEALLRQRPQDIGATIQMGIVLARSGDVEGAKERFRAVLRLDPGNPLAAQNLRILEAGGR